MATVPKELPIIDVRELDNPETRETFYKKLRVTAREIGFFYLVGHGIAAEEREALVTAMKKFFALPKAEKEKIAMLHSRHFRGYSAVTEEYTRTKPDYREQFDFGEELPEKVISDTDPIWLNLEGPNQWPEQIPELKTLALQWQEKTHALAIKLIKAFLVALELPENSLDEVLQNPPQHEVKLVHYPRIDPSEQSDQGVGSHKDVGLLTLLWQDNVGGLQVLTDQGWIDIAPIENAFVINIGETLELVTNGYLRANIHQVVRPVNGESRYSIPYFLRPSMRVKGVPFLPLPEHLAKLALGPESDPLNPLFNDLAKNVMKGKLRSHLSITQKFYPKEYAQILEKDNIA